MELDDINKMMNIIAMEGRYRDDWEWDNNTTLLLAVKDTLAGMLKATLDITNNLQDLKVVNALGLVQALSEILNGLMDNINLVKKDGTNCGIWKQ